MLIYAPTAWLSTVGANLSGFTSALLLLWPSSCGRLLVAVNIQTLQLVGPFRSNAIIPLTMKLVGLDIHSCEFFIAHLRSFRIGPAIKTAADLQPFGGRRSGNEVDDRLIIAKWLTLPV